MKKIAVCIYHHFIITRKDKEKLRYVYIITLLSQGRLKKSFPMYITSAHDNKEGLRNVAVGIYQHFIIKRNDEKSCGMYISSVHY